MGLHLHNNKKKAKPANCSLHECGRRNNSSVRTLQNGIQIKLWHNFNMDMFSGCVPHLQFEHNFKCGTFPENISILKVCHNFIWIPFCSVLTDELFLLPRSWSEQFAGLAFLLLLCKCKPICYRLTHKDCHFPLELDPMDFRICITTPRRKFAVMEINDNK